MWANQNRKHFLTVRPRLTLCLKDSPAYVRLNAFGYGDYFYGSVDGDCVLEVRLDPFAKPRDHSLPVRDLHCKDKAYSFRVAHTRLTLCRLSGGAIAGIIICVVLSISLILLGVFIWRCRERFQASSSKTSRRRTIDIETLQTKNSFGTGPVIHHTPSLPALPPLRIPSPSNSIMISVSPIESDSDAEGDNKPLTPLNVDSAAVVLVPHGNSLDGHHGLGLCRNLTLDLRRSF